MQKQVTRRLERLEEAIPEPNPKLEIEMLLQYMTEIELDHLDVVLKRIVADGKDPCVISEPDAADVERIFRVASERRIAGWSRFAPVLND